MRTALVAAVLMLGSAGCAISNEPAEGEGTEAQTAAAALTSAELKKWGFTYLDFTPAETMVATLANPSVVPPGLTLLSADTFGAKYEIPLKLVSVDYAAGKATYTKSLSTGPLLSLHWDCGDAQQSASGTLAPKAWIFLPLRYSVITILKIKCMKPGVPEGCTSN